MMLNVEPLEPLAAKLCVCFCKSFRGEEFLPRLSLDVCILRDTSPFPFGSYVAVLFSVISLLKTPLDLMYIIYHYIVMHVHQNVYDLYIKKCMFQCNNANFLFADFLHSFFLLTTVGFRLQNLLSFW